MYSHVLVPIDDSVPAQRGLDEAISLAVALDARLHVLHVVDLRSLITGGAGFAPAEDLVADWTSVAEVLLAQAVERARLRGARASSAVCCDPGLRVCDAILEEARRCGAELIVMGTHGRRGLTRLALGSNAETVLRESPVPVLLVRTPTVA